MTAPKRGSPPLPRRRDPRQFSACRRVPPGGICIIETKTVGDEDPVASPTGIWRYQHGNHLGSVATEVDGSGAIISYEEYHPYGTSAYRAVDSSIDVSAKRYRYTGMERDEETGLAYHSARYYANWLGRWTASDPIAIGDGNNRFTYVSARPVVLLDATGTLGASPPEASDIVADRLNDPKGWDDDILRLRTFLFFANHGVAWHRPAVKEDRTGGASLPTASNVAPEFDAIVEIEGPEGGDGTGEPGAATTPKSSEAEQFAALIGVLSGEELDTTTNETRMGLDGGLAEPGTEVSAGTVAAAIAVREVLFDLALGFVGFAGRILRKLNLDEVAKRTDGLIDQIRSIQNRAGDSRPGSVSARRRLDFEPNPKHGAEARGKDKRPEW